MTSVYDFYQYWRNVPDEDVTKFFLTFTFLPTRNAASSEPRRTGPSTNPRNGWLLKSPNFCIMREEAVKARDAARAVFAGGGDVSGVPSCEISKSEFEAGINILDLFARTELCSSKSEARRLVQQGGARVNDEKIDDVDAVVGSDAVRDGEVMLKAGKKRFFRIEITA